VPDPEIRDFLDEKRRNYRRRCLTTVGICPMMASTTSKLFDALLRAMM